MKHIITAEISNSDNIILELDDSIAPKTVLAFVKNLPFRLDANIWGKEIYTSPAPFSIPSENAKDVVELHDVAFWPQGNAICLFYGPTPIGTKNEIKPYSSVNVIGKIINPNIKVLSKILDNTQIAFRSSQS
ncbi:MAG: cyclophilin-like fold protein [Candidatus Nitrosotenuis sp.]